MPNYLLAGEWSIQVHALAMCESSGNPAVPPSDNGQARGLLGIHPSFFVQWYGRGSFPATTADTWDDADIKCAGSYLEHEVPRIGIDGAVQAWNEGVGFWGQGRRDPAYLAKYDSALNQLKGTT